jgi:hypothetical protein
MLQVVDDQKKLHGVFWDALHSDYWGIGKLVANEILDFSAYAEPLKILQSTKSRILVRQDDLDTYCRLKDAQVWHGVGALITGQPGNGQSHCMALERLISFIHPGKSYLLIVLLIRCLQERKPVFYLYTEDTIYYFDKSGAYRLTPEDLTSLPEGATRKDWMLLEWMPLREPNAYYLLFFWPVQASSPNPVRYKGWALNGSPSGEPCILLTKKWSIDELERW